MTSYNFTVTGKRSARGSYENMVWAVGIIVDAYEIEYARFRDWDFTSTKENAETNAIREVALIYSLSEDKVRKVIELYGPDAPKPETEPTPVCVVSTPQRT